MLNRRSFLTGLTSLIAAPAIVRVASIMPVKAMPSAEEAYAALAKGMSNNLYGNLIDSTRAAFVPRLFVEIYRADPLLAWIAKQ